MADDEWAAPLGVEPSSNWAETVEAELHRAIQRAGPDGRRMGHLYLRVAVLRHLLNLVAGVRASGGGPAEGPPDTELLEAGQAVMRAWKSGQYMGNAIDLLRAAVAHHQQGDST